MSADATPIHPARFATAIKELSVEMLHIKVLEIRNSIAHLQYSNDQLKPFAEGSAVPGTTSTGTNQTTATEPDQDCIDAIKENEGVIERMAERIAIIRMEVEDRGVSWTEFQSKDELEEQQRQREQRNGSSEVADQEESVSQVNGHGTGSASQSSPWTDGTFQTGTIRNGQVHFDAPRDQSQGGSLSDEQLRRALEERLRDLGHDDGADDADGGMHL